MPQYRLLAIARYEHNNLFFCTTRTDRARSGYAVAFSPHTLNDFNLKESENLIYTPCSSPQPKVHTTKGHLFHNFFIDHHHFGMARFLTFFIGSITCSIPYICTRRFGSRLRARSPLRFRTPIPFGAAHNIQYIILYTQYEQKIPYFASTRARMKAVHLFKIQHMTSGIDPLRQSSLLLYDAAAAATASARLSYAIIIIIIKEPETATPCQARLAI